MTVILIVLKKKEPAIKAKDCRSLLFPMTIAHPLSTAIDTVVARSLFIRTSFPKYAYFQAYYDLY